MGILCVSVCFVCVPDYRWPFRYALAEYSLILIIEINHEIVRMCVVVITIIIAIIIIITTITAVSLALFLNVLISIWYMSADGLQCQPGYLG